MEKLSGRNITEIVKYTNSVALINPAFAGDVELMGLVGQFQDGLPQDWKLLSPSRYLTNIFVNSRDKPQYIAKVRRFAHPKAIDFAKHVTADEWFSATGKLRSADREVSKMVFWQGRKHEYALNSLLNEIVLSPKIAQCLAIPEAAEICTQYGVGEVVFVAPIFGMIYRKTGQKVMVYPWIGNQHGSATSLGLWTENNFANKLNQLFRENHIEPLDLLDRQLLAVRGEDQKIDLRTIYLVDAEGYIEI